VEIESTEDPPLGPETLASSNALGLAKENRKAIEVDPLFRGLSEDMVTVVATLRYIIKESSISNYHLLKRDKLAIALIPRAHDARVHQHQAFLYNGGCFDKVDGIEEPSVTHLCVAEGVLLETHEKQKGTPVEWAWALVKPFIKIALGTSDQNVVYERFKQVAKEKSDYIRRETGNKPWNAHWIQRLADMLSKVGSFFEGLHNMAALNRLYLDTCNTPLPLSKGIMFKDKYLNERYEVAEPSRNNNCYFRVHYNYEVCECDITEDGWTLEMYMLELDLWISSQYYKNEGFFTVKLMFYALAYNSVTTGKEAFEVGEGGDGKGLEGIFESNIFGDGFTTLDCGVFIDRTEWRRSAHFAWNMRCVRVQEMDASGQFAADLWKRWVVGEKLDVRENYGKTSKKEFGISHKTQECNPESIPTIEKRSRIWSPDEAVRKQIKRRIVACRMGKATLVTEPSEVDPPNGKFLLKSQDFMHWFLQSAITATLFFRHYLLPFMKEYTVKEMLRLLDNLGEISEDLDRFTTWMARRLSGDESLDLDEDKVEDTANQTIRAVHKYTPQRPVVKLSYFCDLPNNVLYGLKKVERSKKGKCSKLDTLQCALEKASINVFQLEERGGGYKKLMICLDKMESALRDNGGERVFGHWSDWGDTFALKDEQQSLPDASDEYISSIAMPVRIMNSIPEMRKMARNVVCTVNEVINIKLLTAYMQRHCDSKQTVLERTVARHLAEGHCVGDESEGFWSTPISYSRKGGYGRLFAIGFSLQKCSATARSFAFRMHSADVDQEEM